MPRARNVNPSSFGSFSFSTWCEDGATEESGKSHGGRATKRTPAKAIRPADASLTVYGSLNHKKQTKAVMVGTINVMTVASENSNHDSESVWTL